VAVINDFQQKVTVQHHIPLMSVPMVSMCSAYCGGNDALQSAMMMASRGVVRLLPPHRPMYVCRDFRIVSVTNSSQLLKNTLKYADSNMQYTL